MRCPQCSQDVPEGVNFCPSCGAKLDPSAKALCDACMGAFPPGALASVEGRRLCALCRAREERRREGTPSPGNARMSHTPREFKAAQGLLPKRTSILAILSLVFVFVCPVGLLSILLGALALVQIRRHPKEVGGTGLAVAGMVLGFAALLFVGAVAAVSVPLFMRVEEVAKANLVRAQMHRIQSAERAYIQMTGEVGDWKALVREGLYDPITSHVEGYDLEVEPTETGFQVTATPKPGGPDTHYLLDENGNFRCQEGRAATSSSPLWRNPFEQAARGPVRTSSG